MLLYYILKKISSLKMKFVKIYFKMLQYEEKRSIIYSVRPERSIK